MRVACCAVIGRSVAWASPRRARHRGRAGPPRPDGTGQRAGLLAQRGAHHRQRGSLRGSGARAIAPRPGPCRQGWPPLIILNGRGLLFPRYRDCGSREDGGHEPQAPPVETTPRLNVINPDVELHAGPCRNPGAGRSPPRPDPAAYRLSASTVASNTSSTIDWKCLPPCAARATSYPLPKRPGTRVGTNLYGRVGRTHCCARPP